MPYNVRAGTPRAGRWQVGSKLCRRFTHESFERAVEMSQRLEADFVGNFAHAQIRIEQKVFCFFSAGAGHEFRESDCGRLPEGFTEMKEARVDRAGYLPKRETFGEVVQDELLGVGNERRLHVSQLDGDLIAFHRKMVGEDRQEIGR